MNILTSGSLVKRANDIHTRFGWWDEQYSFPEIEPLPLSPQRVCLSRSPSLSLSLSRTHTHKRARTHVYIAFFWPCACIHFLLHRYQEAYHAGQSGWYGDGTRSDAFLSRESVVGTEPWRKHYRSHITIRFIFNLFINTTVYNTGINKYVAS
jgi:hypothetical protein